MTIQNLWLKILPNTMMTTHFMDPVAVGRHRCEAAIWLLCIIMLATSLRRGRAPGRTGHERIQLRTKKWRRVTPYAVLLPTEKTIPEKRLFSSHTHWKSGMRRKWLREGLQEGDADPVSFRNAWQASRPTQVTKHIRILKSWQNTCYAQ